MEGKKNFKKVVSFRFALVISKLITSHLILQCLPLSNITLALHSLLLNKKKIQISPQHLEPVLRNKRGRDNERPAHRDEEWPPLGATTESPRTETKTQHSHK